MPVVFNIGAEGQLFMDQSGSLGGFTIKGLPPIIHVPLALGVGFLAGRNLGSFPDCLKAKTGAHVVNNTIMMIILR